MIKIDGDVDFGELEKMLNSDEFVKWVINALKEEDQEEKEKSCGVDDLPECVGVPFSELIAEIRKRETSELEQVEKDKSSRDFDGEYEEIEKKEKLLEEKRQKIGKAIGKLRIAKAKVLWKKAEYENTAD